ncbi:MAG: pentapeptide repeat-containing protein [Pseudomonadota bacterium]
MANTEHLDWLSEGVDAWNRRRRESPFTPELGGADLSGRSLWRFNLRGANLRRADLHSVNLQHADLETADLSQANLYRADLRGARLERANFNRATLKYGKMERCDLRSARLDGADLTSARFEEADLRGADLRAWFAAKQDEPRNAFEAAFRRAPAPIVTITTAQLRMATGDAGTLLPDGVDRPDHWEVGEEDPEALRLKATPAAEFDWRDDGKLGATRLTPVPPRPQGPMAEPLDGLARDQQLMTVSALAEKIAVSVEAYDATQNHNYGPLAKSVAVPMRAIAEETAKPANEVLIALVRAHVSALSRLKGEQAEALADVDRVLFEQLLIEWDRLVPFYPVLGQIDNPRNAAIAPEGSAAEADAFVEQVMSAVNSEAGREVLSEETREVFEAENRQPTPLGEEGKKDRLVRVAALAAALGHALDRAPKNVKRVGLFTGFALTIKDLLEVVWWIFL